MTAPTAGPTFEERLERIEAALAQLRLAQEELARSVGELERTFRAIALRLGIALEPYRPSTGRSSPPPTGFA